MKANTQLKETKDRMKENKRQTGVPPAKAYNNRNLLQAILVLVTLGR